MDKIQTSCFKLHKNFFQETIPIGYSHVFKIIIRLPNYFRFPFQSLSLGNGINPISYMRKLELKVIKTGSQPGSIHSCLITPARYLPVKRTWPLSFSCCCMLLYMQLQPWDHSCGLDVALAPDPIWSSPLILAVNMKIFLSFRSLKIKFPHTTWLHFSTPLLWEQTEILTCELE